MKRVLVGVVVAILFGSTPTASASSKDCGKRVYAGKNTSCQLARALFRKVGRDPENIGDGKRVRVKSPVTGRKYSFSSGAPTGARSRAARMRMGCCQFA